MLLLSSRSASRSGARAFHLRSWASGPAYLALAAGTDPAATWLTPLQLALQTAALLPATLLMGCALPLLARQLATRAEDVGRAAGSFYGINIAGAAAGSVVGGYVLQPALGITQTLFVAVALEVLAATLAILLSRGAEGGPRTAQHPPMLEAGAAPERLRRLAWIALVVTCLDGVVTLALATIYVHLLAVVAGNSTYAYSLMVFAFLVGLAAGTVAGRRLLRTAIGFPELLVACQMGLALVVLVGTYLWNETPAHFANYEHYIIVRTFGSREAVRFAVCGLAMIPPAFFVGAAYPLVMAWVGAANPGREIAAVGRAGALNTAGNILGAILGGCVLIPLLGSLRSIQVIAVVALGLSALVLLAVEKHRSSWGLAVAMAAALFPLQPRSFDYTRLASGANIYFANQPYGRVIDHAESLDGGLTTIAESSDPGGRRVLTMLTNGKFQGDDSAGRKAEAQVFSSLVPLLHGEERGPALIVGLGTGVSARVASDADQRRVHIAEHSRDVVDMVARYFGKANGNVLARPSTVSHVTDERNIFALDSRRYGFIGLEVSSIWFAGAARLYNREFYAIARAHLASRGVLEQRVQMHRLSHADLLSIVATARAEFSHVWLYFTPNQGVLVACDWDCRPSATSVRRLTAEPRLAADLDLVGGVAKLLDRRVLGPDEVDQFIAGAREYGLNPEQIVATDDNLLLAQHPSRKRAALRGVARRQPPVRAPLRSPIAHRGNNADGGSVGLAPRGGRPARGFTVKSSDLSPSASAVRRLETRKETSKSVSPIRVSEEPSSSPGVVNRNSTWCVPAGTETARIHAFTGKHGAAFPSIEASQPGNQASASTNSAGAVAVVSTLSVSDANAEMRASPAEGRAGPAANHGEGKAYCSTRSSSTRGSRWKSCPSRMRSIASPAVATRLACVAR